MSKPNLNNLRLFFKGLVTAWVPVVVIFGIVTWSPEAVALVMGASVVSIDGLFRVWNISDETVAKP